MTDRLGFAIDPDTNDLFLEADGSLAVVSDAHAVGQHIRQRLKTFAREWFLDTTVGMLWLDELFGKQYDPALAESLVKAEILNTDGAVEILSFSVRFDRATRGLIITDVEVRTDYDERVEI